MLPPFHVLSLVLALPIPVAPTQFPFQQPNNASPSPITLYLRHLHVTGTAARRVLFADVPPEPRSPHAADVDSDPRRPYTLDTVLQTTHRPSSLAAHAHARKAAVRLGKGLHHDTAGELTWEEDVIAGPDVTSRETLVMLAKMTSNAYLYPDEDEWYDLEGKWNVSYPFGWEEDADGLRGHVFVSADNKTVAISVKGTSAGFFGGSGPTAPKDKTNDNLLFSCCCAKVGFSWTPVCGCWAGGWTCDRNCVEESLWTDDSFYPVGADLYNNISYMYPDANIWIIGHSLGGALASLLGVTFGAPVVAFESPGEKMAAGRLHLPSPPSTQHVTHVYHTADPVPMGTCTGVLSSCAIAGFAFESRCHLGKTILYDTVRKLNWSVSIRSHPIEVVIDMLEEKHNWDSEPDDGDEMESATGAASKHMRSEQKYKKSDEGKSHLPVPIAEPEEDCVECYKWEYGDFLDPGNW
ncbi:Alpha/Beta hydrolase protein [Gautieria morchelliformis]|nr:Alpha/Beta hydrolase protein [Gautieria morchelliformis]